MNKYKLLFLVSLCFAWKINDDMENINNKFSHNQFHYYIQEKKSPVNQPFADLRDTDTIINEYIVLDSMYMELWLDYQNLYWLHYKKYINIQK